jgi:hypothetical protein
MSVRAEFPIGYCTLEYCARNDESFSSDIEKVILIAIGLTTGELSIRVHPDWRQIVISADHSYLQSTLDDLAQRARRDPESLLRQISTLSVGPLQTYDVGQTLADRPDLLRLLDRFMEI